MSALVAAALCAAAALAAAAEKPFDVGTTHEVFRKNFPEPAGVARARAEWRRVEQRFSQRALRGVLVRVEFSGEGFSGEGVDHVIAGDPPRLRELRDGSELIAAGSRLCRRDRPAGEWACEDADITHGLASPEWDAVVELSDAPVACGSLTCRRWKVLQAKVIRFENMALYSQDPSKSYTFHAFVVDADGRLRQLEIVEHSPWPDAGRVRYEYDYDAGVPAITLPE
jgi:hypothetical protein